MSWYIMAGASRNAFRKAANAAEFRLEDTVAEACARSASRSGFESCLGPASVLAILVNSRTAFSITSPDPEAPPSNSPAGWALSSVSDKGPARAGAALRLGFQRGARPESLPPSPKPPHHHPTHLSRSSCEWPRALQPWLSALLGVLVPSKASSLLFHQGCQIKLDLAQGILQHRNPDHLVCGPSSERLLRAALEDRRFCTYPSVT